MLEPIEPKLGMHIKPPQANSVELFIIIFHSQHGYCALRYSWGNNLNTRVTEMSDPIVIKRVTYVMPPETISKESFHLKNLLMQVQFGFYEYISVFKHPVAFNVQKMTIPSTMQLCLLITHNMSQS
jgi:hypothetical protein